MVTIYNLKRALPRAPTGDAHVRSHYHPPYQDLETKRQLHTDLVYADDAATTGKITDLRDWWDKLTKEGPDFGYFPNPSKTWLVTKEGSHTSGTSTFADTGVNVTSDGST